MNHPRELWTPDWPHGRRRRQHDVTRPPGMSLLLTGVGGMGVQTPLQILGSANLPFWMRADAGMYLDTGFTMPTSSNNATILGVQDQSGNADNATQATSGNAFTLKTNQINGLPALQSPGQTANYAFGSTINLTGAFTVYAVCNMASSSWMEVIGSLASGSFLGISNAGNIYFYLAGVSGASAPYTGSTGKVLLRWRRNASNNCLFSASGMSEISVVNPQAGTYVLDNLFTRNTLEGVSAGNQAGEIVVANVDTVASGQDAGLRAWLSRWGTTIP